ncbi:MAG: GTP-binding protein [Scytolyngbya sp. HA4215-MV1]|jgi:internalin A|nr:GTP-binding protein [Scytolyngbya sp. HA4215-MV1]
MTHEELLQIIVQAARDKSETLDLSGQDLIDLPAEISKLTYLRKLDLSDNQLTTLPAEISHLISLSGLDLSHNQLTTLPAEIGTLINLSGLNLSHNQINTLPSAIGHLSNLSELDLSHNQLSNLPVAIGRLTNLTGLYLSANQLTALPPEIGNLTHLSLLYLRANRLRSLPPEIGSLARLSWLYLRANQLVVLPSEIGNLSYLSELDLRDNQLTALPTEIGNLIDLSEMDLSHNQLITLPTEIRRLNHLQKLDLRGNPLPIPPEILEECWYKLGEPAKILDYYFQLQIHPDQSLNEAKVLIVGQGSVGKTSLIKRLIENRFDPQERKTEGINIQNWRVAVNNQAIRLNIWDFGGQEIMHATHQFFLTKRSLYLLVLDARLGEDENRIEYWLKMIQSYGGDSPVIIVGNKIDQNPLDIDQRGLQTKYANVQAIVMVSCETGAGLETLKNTLIQAISNLEHIHDPLPQSWFEVKNCLEQMQQDYIPYSDYEHLCQQWQITDILSRNTLIELLHRLGIVLNFRDDPRLAEMGVLNPEWVTNGVYKILNDNLLITEYRGILDGAHLNRILDSPRYPPSKQLFIVDMMRRFELCFLLEEGKGDRFLIPDLLPKEEPATGDWDDALAFQYAYEVLPNSVISRFIVRMHHLAEKCTWWRSGIVLKYRHNRALIKADREDRRMFIWVNGAPNSRRELLAMIRSQFNAIHNSIKGLKIQEKVPLPYQPKIMVDYTHLLNLEEIGETMFVPEGLKERVSVQYLLDGVITEQERYQQRQSRENEPRLDLPKPDLEKEIFLSYAWGGESEALVDRLDQTFRQQGMMIVRDRHDLGYKGLIQAFMERIGRGKCVVAVISDKYLKSPNCMFELVQIAKQGQFYHRIFPVVLADAQIYRPVERIRYIKHWEDQIQELDEAMRSVGAANLQGFREEIDQYTEIRNTIAELTSILKNMNTLNSEVHHQSEFEVLIQSIQESLNRG